MFIVKMGMCMLSLMNTIMKIISIKNVYSKEILVSDSVH